MRILDRQGSTFGCLCGDESPLNRPKHTVILSGKIVSNNITQPQETGPDQILFGPELRIRKP